jgi:hypothetical protein
MAQRCCLLSLSSAQIEGRILRPNGNHYSTSPLPYLFYDGEYEEYIKRNQKEVQENSNLTQLSSSNEGGKRVGGHYFLNILERSQDNDPSLNEEDQKPKEKENE